MNAELKARAEKAFYLWMVHASSFRSAMIDWATDVLVAGGEGKNTVWLAGADDLEDCEIIPLFRLALAEQDMPLVASGEEMRWLEGYVCGQLVVGHLPPAHSRPALSRLANESMKKPQFFRWLNLLEDISLVEAGCVKGVGFRDGRTLSIDEAILAEARAVVKERQGEGE